MKRVICSNAHCHSYDYQPDQEVLKLVYKQDKLEPQAQGPYDIIVVHTMLTQQSAFLSTLFAKLS
jgi:hypothetical protein